jgi:hypothetical protein
MDSTEHLPALLQLCQLLRLLAIYGTLHTTESPSFQGYKALPRYNKLPGSSITTLPGQHATRPAGHFPYPPASKLMDTLGTP